MKNLIIFLVVNLAMLLTINSVAKASLSYGYAEATLDNLSSSLTITSVSSEGILTAEWWNFYTYDDSDYRELRPKSETPVLSGQVDVGSASQEIWADEGFVAIESLANPLINTVSHAMGYSEQFLYFTVNQSGTISFTLNYLIHNSLNTDISGEAAYSYSKSGLILWNTEGQGLGSDLFLGLNEVYDGDSDSWSYSGLLSINHTFSAGDTGYLEFFVASDAKARTLVSNIVPLPATILLGLIGLGVGGWKLRKSS